jgi:hypothetical protein
MKMQTWYKEVGRRTNITKIVGLTIRVLVSSLNRVDT